MKFNLSRARERRGKRKGNLFASVHEASGIPLEWGNHHQGPKDRGDEWDDEEKKRKVNLNLSTHKDEKTLLNR